MHKEFAFHALNTGGVARSNAVREAFDRLLTEVEVLVPAGRESAIMRTKLEEASFFAQKSLAGDPRNARGAEPQGQRVEIEPVAAPLPPPPPPSDVQSAPSEVAFESARPMGTGRVDPRTGALISGD